MTTDIGADEAQLSAAMIQKVGKFADEVAWKRPDLDVLKPELSGQYPAVIEAVQQHIKWSDARKRLVLPDLRAFANETVAVFTDYAGEHKEAKYLTYATLVCGWNLVHDFLQAMKIVRQQHDLGAKEIAFKDFGMGQLQRSLPGYLAALDFVPGFLFTLAVDKRLATLFGPQGKQTRELIASALTEADLGGRRPKVNEKLLRIVHVAAFLTAMLAHDNHKIFWITDHDAISPTPEVHRENTLVLFQRVLGLYARENLNPALMGGALPFAERSLETLDLLSATDVTAGAIEHFLSRSEAAPAEEPKEGSDLVLRWLAHDGPGLKKMNVIVTPGEKGAVAGALEFRLQDAPSNALIIPVRV
jgi:hypothetical protein